MPFRKLYEHAEFFPRHGFPVVVQRFNDHPQMDLHAHEFCELVLICSGQGLHVTEDEEYMLATGDVFVISGKRRHGYRHTEKLDLINVLYEPERLPGPLEDLGQLPGYHVLFKLEPAYRQRHAFKSRLRLGVEQLARATGFIHQMENELHTAAPGYRSQALAYFTCLLGHLSRSYAGSPAPASQQLLRIGEAMSYIEKHYNEPIDLSQLAKIAHMSKRSFQRTFQEAMNTSPINYLIRLRVARAAELLRQDELCIAEVAFEAGFSDSNYFSRKFREIMGVSPGVFRKRETQH